MRTYSFLCFFLFSLWIRPQHDSLQVIKGPLPQSDVVPALTDPWSGMGMTQDDNMDIVSSCISPQNSEKDCFTMDLQLCSRVEYCHGYESLRNDYDNPAGYINERARMSLGYSNRFLSVSVAGQHTGVWGDEGTKGNNGNFSLHEAWAKLQAQQGWFMQVGRQELSYDDERILGAEDWESTGYSHNALKLGFEHGMHKVHGVLGYNQTGEKTIGGTYYDGDMPYKTMQFVWYHYGKDSAPFQFSLMGMNLGFEHGSEESPKTDYMQTLGGWLKVQKWGFYGKAEGYYQIGKGADAREMGAYLAGGRLGYEGKAWGATLGGDYVSGSKTSSQEGTNHCFNLLYGSSHDFFGAMDYFTSSNMYSCGLLDVMGKAYVKPIKNGYLNVDYHYFMTGVKRKQLHRQLGHEVDVRLGYNIYKDVCIEAGYSIMMPTSVMVYFQGSGSTKCLQNWGWLSLNFSPRIFSSKR